MTIVPSKTAPQRTVRHCLRFTEGNQEGDALSSLTPKDHATRGAGERGSILLYLVVGLAAFGVMLTAGVVAFSSSARSTLAPNCALQSRHMSEAGIRYAAAKLRSCTNIAEVTTAINEMNNHGAYAVDAAKGLTFTVTAAYNSGSAAIVSLGTGCPSSMSAATTTTNLSINLPAVSSGASTNQALQGTYASLPSSWTSGSTTGNVTTTSANLSGGSVINGSYSYVGTNTASCLHISGGVKVGTANNDDYVCSNSCVIVDGGAIVNGDIYSQGDVAVASTVSGDIYSGGDVYLNWGARVSGNIYVKGQVYKPAFFTDYTGKVTTGYAAPPRCTSYVLPAHERVPSTQQLTITGKYTFFGSTNIADKTYAFKSILARPGSKICFDLSTPDSYVNIFDSGPMTISGEVYVRTSTATSCFDAVNRVSDINFKNYPFASRVYADVGDDVTFAGGSNWFGTVYAAGNVYPGGGGTYIGALYTNQNYNPYGAWTYSRFVLSDYVSAYWP